MIHSEHQLIKSLLVGSAILIFHVLLLTGIGLLVIFLSGLINYLVWVLLGGLGLIGGLAFLGFRYMRKQGWIALHQVLSLPEFRGRNVEVNFLGGLASLKIGSDRSARPEIDTFAADRRLEDPEAMRLRELTALARLREKDLISVEEYDRAKKALFD